MKKLIASISAVAVTLILVTTLTLAWVLKGDLINELPLQFIKINTEVTLFKAIDDNRNGIPELDENGAYKFGTGETKYVVTEESTADLAFSITETAFMPTQAAAYRYMLDNKLDVSNTVRFMLMGQTDGLNDALRAFSVEVLLITAKNTMESKGKVYLQNFLTVGEGENKRGLDMNHNTPKIIDDVTVLENEIIGGALSSDKANIKNYMLRFHFESWESLRANYNTGSPLGQITETDYQALQEATVTFPLFRIYLEV